MVTSVKLAHIIGEDTDVRERVHRPVDTMLRTVCVRLGRDTDLGLREWMGPSVGKSFLDR